MQIENKSEAELVEERYARRLNVADDRYSMLNPSVWQGVQERQRKMLMLFVRFMGKPLSETSVLEIGCGGGGNLLELLRMGFSPHLLFGNELLTVRIKNAQSVLPKACTLITGDALKLNFPDSNFDIVYQSTVFSSLLDDDFQALLASKMWKWVKPGGGVLWYDFTYNNPRNKDVRGVALKRIHNLFPDGNLHVHRVTLAPPISRFICSIHPSLYTAFNFFPFLRTHVICWIGKPQL